MQETMSLKKKCLNILTVTDTGEVRTCCNTPQLQAMDVSLQLAEGILKRCTSCVKNLMRHICEFTCSTKQSTFIEPAQLLLNPETGSKLCSHTASAIPFTDKITDAKNYEIRFLSIFPIL